MSPSKSSSTSSSSSSSLPYELEGPATPHEKVFYEKAFGGSGGETAGAAIQLGSGSRSLTTPGHGIEMPHRVEESKPPVPIQSVPTTVQLKTENELLLNYTGKMLSIYRIGKCALEISSVFMQYMFVHNDFSLDPNRNVKYVYKMIK